MKHIVIATLLLAFVTQINGQSSVEPLNTSIRYDCILLNGLFGSSKNGIGLRYKSLYPLNDIVHIGWGVGIESYSSSVKRNFIPLSIEFLGDVFKNGRSPFYMISLGYGIALPEDSDFAEKARGGLMVDISIGYRSKKNTSQPFIAVGYRLQNAFYKGFDTYGNKDKDVIYKRWSLSTGILF